MDAVARPIFDKADADSDGTISLVEAKAVLEGYNLSDADGDLVHHDDLPRPLHLHVLGVV
eukprot:COSAG05_NODE_99_length_19400_cov_50.107559_14_plen_60_part_00